MGLVMWLLHLTTWGHDECSDTAITHMISREPYTLDWVGLFESWIPESWRHGKPTRRHRLLFISVSEKKPYGSHWACLCVSEIEKMRDGNSAVLGRRAVCMARRWRVEFVWVTIFLAILVNFNVSTAESCFHWQRAGPHGHILSYRKK